MRSTSRSTLPVANNTPYPLALHILCLAPLILLLVFSWLYFGNEEAAMVFFRAWAKEHASLTSGMKMVSKFGNVIFYPVYGFLLWSGLRRGRPELTSFVLAYVLAQVIVPLLLVYVLKIVVGRPRPAMGGSFTPLTLDSDYHSFPSGHVTEVIGSTLPFVQRCRKISLTLFLGLYVAVMGFSRICLESHYLSDVAASLVPGSFAGWLAWRFSRLPLHWWSRWTGRFRNHKQFGNNYGRQR